MKTNLTIYISLKQKPAGYLSKEERADIMKEAKKDWKQSGHNWRLPHVETYKLERESDGKKGVIQVTWEVLQ